MPNNRDKINNKNSILKGGEGKGKEGWRGRREKKKERGKEKETYM